MYQLHVQYRDAHLGNGNVKPGGKQTQAQIAEVATEAGQEGGSRNRRGSGSKQTTDVGHSQLKVEKLRASTERTGRPFTMYGLLLYYSAQSKQRPKRKGGTSGDPKWEMLASTERVIVAPKTADGGGGTSTLGQTEKGLAIRHSL